MGPGRPVNAPVIGLAGGICSGKSTAAHALEQAGCLVIDADELGHEVLREPEVRRTLVTWWGEDVLDHDGSISRTRVADIVFEDDAQRTRLEGLVHPRIEARRTAIIDDAPDDVPGIVIDAPLLFEAGVDALCDAVIFIETTLEDRVQRAQTIRGWTREELLRREGRQLALDEKRSRSHHVVVDPGNPEALGQAVLDVMHRISTRHP